MNAEVYVLSDYKETLHLKVIVAAETVFCLFC